LRRAGHNEEDAPLVAKENQSEIKNEEDEDDEEPVRKKPRRNNPQRKPTEKPTESPVALKSRKPKATSSVTPKEQAQVKEEKMATEPGKQKNYKKTKVESKAEEPASVVVQKEDEEVQDEAASAEEDDEAESDDDEKPEVAAKAREKVQSTLTSSGKDPYPDWKPGGPVPYAALCTTFSLIEMTSKRLIISAHCSLFLRQVLRLTPNDLLPTVQLMINKLAADYAGIELGIGESLIMKAIGGSTGRSLQIIKTDQNEIGDLGLVAAKSRSNQPTMFKPKALTVRGVLDGLMGIATVSGDGSQGRKIAGIKKLLSAADAALAGKGSKGIDITTDKGGASETKFIIRFLEGKLRLGLAEKTVLVALAHAMVIHEIEKEGKKMPSSEKLAEGESILKTVYR